MRGLYGKAPKKVRKTVYSSVHVRVSDSPRSACTGHGAYSKRLYQRDWGLLRTPCINNNNFGNASSFTTVDGDMFFTGHDVTGDLRSRGVTNATWGTPRHVEYFSGANIQGITLGLHTVHVVARDPSDVKGRLWSVGNNRFGQLGIGSDLTDTSSWREVTLPGRLDGTSVMAVAAGSCFALAVTEDGDGHTAIWTCGSNCNGQLGHVPSTPIDKATKPIRVRLPGVDGTMAVQGVALGSNYCIALINGQVFGWGCNRCGQLGRYVPNTTHCVPERIPFFQERLVACVAAGYAHTVVACQDGRGYGFGANEFGQCGVGSADLCVREPMAIEGIGAPIRVASCGAEFTVWLTDGGEVWIAGSNARGQLGIGPGIEGSRSPKAVGALEGRPVRWVSAHSQHVLCMTEDGCLLGWGWNEDNRLGLQTCDPSKRRYYTPVEVDGLPGGVARQVIDMTGSEWIHLRWKTWSPSIHRQYPTGVRKTLEYVFMMHQRRDNNILTRLPKDVLFYIFAMATRQRG